VITIVAVGAAVLVVYEIASLYSKGSLDTALGGIKKAAGKVKDTASAAAAKASEGSKDGDAK
jgi:hypothetical protein